MKVSVTRLTQARVEAMSLLVKLRIPFSYHPHTHVNRDKWLIVVERDFNLSRHQLRKLSQAGFAFTGGSMTLDGRH